MDACDAFKEVVDNSFVSDLLEEHMRQFFGQPLQDFIVRSVVGDILRFPNAEENLDMTGTENAVSIDYKYCLVCSLNQGTLLV